VDADGRVVESGSEEAAAPETAERKETLVSWCRWTAAFTHGGRARTGGCLIDMVDDATNTTWAQLGEEETIWAVPMPCATGWSAMGCRCVVRGWKNLYKRRRRRRAAAGRGAGNAVWADVREVGDRLIAASSPQAKGRVERVHGTHQDRLVKKLRRKGIVSHEAANVYLRSEYLAEHNRALRGPRQGRKTITGARRARRNWSDFRLEGAHGERGLGSALTAIAFSNSSRRGGTLRQHGAKCWCARDGTEA